MVSSRTILKNLKNIDNYLIKFGQKKPTYFELLIAEACSNIFHLPLYTIDNDDSSITNRVTWQGNNKNISKAPSGKPDAIIYCYNFCLIIESTLKTGVNQWTQEFAQSIRHCEDFCNNNDINPKDVFVLLICAKLYKDTYRSIKANLRQEYKIVPIEVYHLAKILQTSILAFTLRHVELRKLFNKILDCISNSSSINDFSLSMDTSIKTWQKDVLKLEKDSFIGLKSYEAMEKFERKHVGVSEILKKLQELQVVKQYLNIIGDKINSSMIEESLINQSLAYKLIKTIIEDEVLFEPVPSMDFKVRSLRIIDKVMKIK